MSDALPRKNSLVHFLIVWGVVGSLSALILAVLAGYFFLRPRNLTLAQTDPAPPPPLQTSTNNLNSIQTTGEFAAIGGRNNIIGSNAACAVIAGGGDNLIPPNSRYSVIGGGRQNRMRYGTHTTIAGGFQNTVGWDVPRTGNYGSVGGGFGNTADGDFSTIPGGCQNWAAGNYCFAAGRRAKAFNTGTFVWADSQDADITDAGVRDSMTFRCRGGVRFMSGGQESNQTVSWTPGSGGWSFTSDQNVKERLQPVSPKAVLEKVSRLPIAEWNYRNYPQRHIGPTAQDFHQLFPLNADDKLLNDSDLHGVTLAAIQGLNQKLEEQLKAKTSQIEALQHRLEQLEKLISTP